MKKSLLLYLFILLSTLLAAPGYFVKGSEHIAIRGYDTVSYFTVGKAEPGVKGIECKYSNALWRFTSISNKNLFQADPEKYLPAYGGYCAWGLGAKGKLYPIDPHMWSIVDGRLYLNYSDEVKKLWLKDPKSFIDKADTIWADLNQNNN